MNGNTTHRRSLMAMIGLAVAVGLLTPQKAKAQVTRRPISDFISAQGTTVNFWPPVPDYVGWYFAKSDTFAIVDYAGVAYRWIKAQPGHRDLGTTIAGSVSERLLRDGRVEVSVLLLTGNALMFVSPGTEFPNPTLLFGNVAPDVANGATPGLGTSQFEVVFTNPGPNQPLPDLVDAFILGHALPGQEWIRIRQQAIASGPLHAAAGLGPDGTPGLAVLSPGTLNLQAIGR